MNAAPSQPLRSSRIDALRFALRGLLHKPLTLTVSSLCIAAFLAATVLAGTAAWRMWPLSRPVWAVPAALVFAARGERLADLDTLRDTLRQTGPVVAVEFVGRDAARAALVARKSLADSGLNDLQPNPLPDGFIVRFDPDAPPGAIEAAVAAMRVLPGVTAAAYEPGTARKLHALTLLATRVGTLLALALLAALLTMLRAARLAGSPRTGNRSLWMEPRFDHDELRVFLILGVEPAVLRRPDVYAAAIRMALAGALAAMMIRSAGAWLDPVIAEIATEYSLRWSDAPVPSSAAWLLCPTGALLGAMLASLAIRAAMRRAALAR